MFTEQELERLHNENLTIRESFHKNATRRRKHRAEIPSKDTINTLTLQSHQKGRIQLAVSQTNKFFTSKITTHTKLKIKTIISFF